MSEVDWASWIGLRVPRPTDDGDLQGVARQSKFSLELIECLERKGYAGLFARPRLGFDSRSRIFHLKQGPGGARSEQPNGHCGYQ